MHRTRKSALRKRKTSTKEENTAKVSKLDFTNDDGFLPLTASISGLLNHRRPRFELHLGEASVSDFLEGQVTLIFRAICCFSASLGTKRLYSNRFKNHAKRSNCRERTARTGH